VLVWDKGRFTKTSVRALLADVYLWQGALSASKDETDKSHASYAACKAECDTLLLTKSPQIMMVDGKYLLSEVFYQGNSAESLLELQFEDKGQLNTKLFDFYGSKTSPTGNVLAYASKLQTLFDATDVRFKDAYETAASANYIFKYVGAYRTVDNDNVSTYHYRPVTDAVNWIMYRLPDVYLMKAEAMIELDSTATNVVPYINMTYARANEGAEGLSSTLYGSKAQMRSLLRLERQREFLFEGKRWFDLIRYARTDKSVGTLVNEVSEKIGTEGAYKLMNPDAWFLPVPYDDIKTSFGTLVQNPFYE
jgi:starch-binding outer membrane protein, SusD/RagB family